MLKATRCAAMAVVLSLSVPAFGSVAFPLADSGWTVSAASDLNVNVMVDDIHWSEDPDDSYVLLQVHKKFRAAPDEQGNFSPIALTFVQTAADAETVPNIRIADEAITNLTGSPWRDFHWILSKFRYASFNTDVPVYVGEPSEAPAGVWGISPFGAYGWELGPTTEELRVYDGVIPNWGSYYPGIHSSGALEINVDLPGAPKNFSFDLKELPTIPEPATLALLAAGSALMIRKRRRA